MSLFQFIAYRVSIYPHWLVLRGKMQMFPSKFNASSLDTASGFSEVFARHQTKAGIQALLCYRHSNILFSTHEKKKMSSSHQTN